MDQSEAPILDGLVDYRKSNRYGFTPPGHRQGRGTDDRVLAVLGHEPFRDDILASGGLDDRRAGNKYLKRAEDLMAEAVGADSAFFSTCGSSASVKAAMMAVAGRDGSLLVARDSHKSIVVMVYAALDGWRRQMVEHGRELLGNALEFVRGLRDDIELIPDVEVLDHELLGTEASHDLDRLQILMDLSATGTSGYQAADWLRQHRQIDLGMSDHRRLLATMSFADDKQTGERLLDGLWAWRKAANDFESPPPIRLPSPSEIELETVQLPREAFFGEVEAVPAETANGRISAEQLTPYPPGIPAVVPGERLNDAVIDYLRTGLAAGMNIPDAADTSLKTFRVAVT